MKKMRWMLVLAVALFLCTGAALANEADFVGTWHMNEFENADFVVPADVEKLYCSLQLNADGTCIYRSEGEELPTSWKVQDGKAVVADDWFILERVEDTLQVDLGDAKAIFHQDRREGVQASPSAARSNATFDDCVGEWQLDSVIYNGYTARLLPESDLNEARVLIRDNGVVEGDILFGSETETYTTSTVQKGSLTVFDQQTDNTLKMTLCTDDRLLMDTDGSGDFLFCFRRVSPVQSDEAFTLFDYLGNWQFIRLEQEGRIYPVLAPSRDSGLILSPARTCTVIHNGESDEPEAWVQEKDGLVLQQSNATITSVNDKLILHREDGTDMVFSKVPTKEVTEMDFLGTWHLKGAIMNNEWVDKEDLMDDMTIYLKQDGTGKFTFLDMEPMDDTWHMEDGRVLAMGDAMPLTWLGGGLLWDMGNEMYYVYEKEVVEPVEIVTEGTLNDFLGEWEATYLYRDGLYYDMKANKGQAVFTFAGDGQALLSIRFESGWEADYRYKAEMFKGQMILTDEETGAMTVPMLYSNGTMFLDEDKENLRDGFMFKKKASSQSDAVMRTDVRYGDFAGIWKGIAMTDGAGKTNTIEQNDVRTELLVYPNGEVYFLTTINGEEDAVYFDTLLSEGVLTDERYETYSLALYTDGALYMWYDSPKRGKTTFRFEKIGDQLPNLDAAPKRTLADFVGTWHLGEMIYGEQMVYPETMDSSLSITIHQDGTAQYQEWAGQELTLFTGTHVMEGEVLALTLEQGDVLHLQMDDQGRILFDMMLEGIAAKLYLYKEVPAMPLEYVGQWVSYAVELDDNWMDQNGTNAVITLDIAEDGFTVMEQKETFDLIIFLYTGVLEDGTAVIVEEGTSDNTLLQLQPDGHLTLCTSDGDVQIVYHLKKAE